MELVVAAALAPFVSKLRLPLRNVARS